MKLPQPSSKKPVPSATYKVRLISYEHGHSKNKGTPQITWKAEILEGEFAGQNLWERTIMTESSLWKTSNLLGACSLDVSKGVDTDSPLFTALCQAAMGRKSYWQVLEKTLDTGKVVNEIKDYAVDEDQELLEVAMDSNAPDWIEKEVDGVTESSE